MNYWENGGDVMQSDYDFVERTYLFKNSKGVYYAITGLTMDIADLKDDCICEIDELIASPVAELCNKGYVTKYSCSGHAFGDVDAEPIEEEYTEGRFENVIEVKYIDSIGATMVCKFVFYHKNTLRNLMIYMGKLLIQILLIIKFKVD